MKCTPAPPRLPTDRVYLNERIVGYYIHIGDKLHKHVWAVRVAEMSWAELQKIIDDLNNGQYSTAEMRCFLKSPAAVIRAKVLSVLPDHVKHMADDKGRNDLINDIAATARDPINQISLFGFITVAFMAIGCLLQVGTPGARVIANQLIDALSDVEREDLERYLRNELDMDISLTDSKKANKTSKTIST